MRKTRIKLSIIAIAGLLALVAIVSLSSAEPPVALTILGYKTNHWPNELAQIRRERDYVSAILVVTNRSSQAITYWAFYDPKFVSHRLLHKTALGWKEPAAGLLCGTGMKRCTLAPAQGITFEAEVDRARPCKVALDYSDGRTPSKLWQQLPRWVVQRLPWARSSQTVTSDEINFGSVEP